MLTIPDRILELIALKLNDEATPEEVEELMVWLHEDKRHQEEWNIYEQLHFQSRLLDQPFSPDIEKALLRVKISRRSFPVWKKAMRWAAVLALPLCVALWLLYDSFPEEDNRLFSQVARPGEEKAILKIGDRQQISLVGGMDTLIVTEDGAKIKADPKDMLSYLADTLQVNVKQNENQLIVPPGGEYRIVLPDGTRVWLNSVSVLTFPQVFTGNERRVQLVGEAYFEVKPDAAHPFIVSTVQMDIKVLGTSFNVSVYDDEDAVHTTLVQGSVEVKTANDAVLLKPGEQAFLSDCKLTCQAVNVQQFTSWIKGKFMFCNTRLEDIAKQISRWYDVDIFFSSERVKNICFTGAILRFEPLEELIRMIELTSNVRFGVKGKTIVVSEF